MAFHLGVTIGRLCDLERGIPKGSPLPIQTIFPSGLLCLYEPTSHLGRTQSPAPIGPDLPSPCNQNPPASHRPNPSHCQSPLHTPSETPLPTPIAHLSHTGSPTPSWCHSSTQVLVLPSPNEPRLPSDMHENLNAIPHSPDPTGWDLTSLTSAPPPPASLCLATLVPLF